MDNSLPSVDDVIRAITGQSPRQSVDEIMGAVNQLLAIEVENRTVTGAPREGGSSSPQDPTRSSSSSGIRNTECDRRIP